MRCIVTGRVMAIEAARNSKGAYIELWQKGELVNTKAFIKAEDLDKHSVEEGSDLTCELRVSVNKYGRLDCLVVS